MTVSYRDAGVDIDAGNRLIKRILPSIERTRRREILSNLGGFNALSALPGDLTDPILVTATDGVGTKLLLANQYERHNFIGQDLVAMCVNDVLVSGAEPLLFLDYFATDAINIDVATEVIDGIATACSLAGCALAGGETAEMPDLYPTSTYDLAGFCLGVVERTKLKTSDLIDVGDVILGISSSGPHSNGYSLIRKLMDRQVPSNPQVLEQILAPTRIYVRSILPNLDQIKGLCHITGGGFRDNLPRTFPKQLAAHINLNSWHWPICFDWIRQAASLPTSDLLATFNCGLGMLVYTAPDDADRLAKRLESCGETVHLIGEFVAADTALKAPYNVAVTHDELRVT